MASQASEIETTIHSSFIRISNSIVLAIFKKKKTNKQKKKTNKKKKNLPRRVHRADEELTAVGARPSVGL